MEQKFIEWIASIKKNYQQSQIKAAIKVNSNLIAFYFQLGKEISKSDFKREYGNSFFKTMSDELKKSMPKSSGFSIENLRYIERFYIIYKKSPPQLVGKFEKSTNIENRYDHFERRFRNQTNRYYIVRKI